MADENKFKILLELYASVLTELKNTTDDWTSDSSLPKCKVPQLPDVSKEEDGNELYETFREHRGYLEELLEKYLYSLRKTAECSDIMKRVWDLRKKYNLTTEDVASEEKKHKYWSHLKVLDVIENRLSEEQQNKTMEVPANQSKLKIKHLEAELEKKTRECENYRMDCEEYKREYKKLKEQKEMQMQKTIHFLVKEKSDYMEYNRTLKREKDSLMHSKIAGSQKKDNDPSIADLGDPNRPVRLAEKYKEIYDNAWIDVLDKLDEVTGEGDSKCVQAILNVLKEIYTECKNDIDYRRRTMMELVGYDVEVLQKQTSPGGNSEYDPNIKTFKDLIKSFARKINESALKVVKGKTEVAEVIKLCGDNAIKFVTNCTDLCIHMSVQDPPVVFDFSYQSGDHFDSDCLNAFTRGGDVIDYLVWPPMYLHTDGPQLSKGIAQGKSTKSKAKESKKNDQQQTSDDPKEATAQKAVEVATKSKRDKPMLSKIAGSEMKDNNPSIADLSDPNRPERLAEKYIEIYHNAWTDVLDKLEEVTIVGESKCVQAILNVLKEIYTECKNEIDYRRRTMMELVGYDVEVMQKQTSLGGNSGYDPNIKTCKDLIKSSARKINESALEVVKGKTEVAEVIKLCEDSAIKFVTNCTDLCIHMSVQDPPVVFDFSYQSGDHFDSDCLNAFTRAGDVIDYLVWPPMYLHTDGPQLSKGIAQGKSTKSKATESKKSDQQQTSDDRKEATAHKAVEEATKSKRDKRNRHNDQEPPENAKDKRNERRNDKPVDIPRTNNEQPSDQNEDVDGNSKEKSNKNLEKGNSNKKNKHSKLNDIAKEMTEQESNERHGEHKQETETKQQTEQHKPEAIQQTNQKEKSAKKRGKGPKESNRR